MTPIYNIDDLLRLYCIMIFSTRYFFNIYQLISYINFLVINVSYILAKKIYSSDFNKIVDTLSHAQQNNLRIDSKILSILIAAEDKRFFYHCGFDVISIIRAIIFYILYQKKSGASTIDQQLIRTITNERGLSIRRKIKEIILASGINKIYNKKKIAYTYINIAYYGWHINGFNTAYKRLKIENIVNFDDILYAIVALLKYPLPHFYSTIYQNKLYNRINYIKRRVIKLKSNTSTISIKEINNEA
jgi:penicillin-binding protein 1A